MTCEFSSRVLTKNKLHAPHDEWRHYRRRWTSSRFLTIISHFSQLFCFSFHSCCLWSEQIYSRHDNPAVEWVNKFTVHIGSTEKWTHKSPILLSNFLVKFHTNSTKIYWVFDKQFLCYPIYFSKSFPLSHKFTKALEWSLKCQKIGIFRFQPISSFAPSSSFYLSTKVRNLFIKHLLNLIFYNFPEMNKFPRFSGVWFCNFFPCRALELSCFHLVSLKFVDLWYV